jgi:hypothetical protein
VGRRSVDGSIMVIEHRAFTDRRRDGPALVIRGDVTRMGAEKLPQDTGEATTSMSRSMTKAEGTGIRTLRSLFFNLNTAKACFEYG